MTNTKNLNRFLAFFLIFSFLILSLAIVPICSVSYVNAALPFESASDTNPALSLIANFSMDYQESQSTAYIYGFLQSIKPKLLNTLVSFVILLVNAALLLAIYARLNPYGIFHKISSVRIVEYLHDKDGMT